MLRKGGWRGVQRWFCRDCKRYFSGREPLDPHLLYEEYLTGKQTLIQRLQRHHISVSTVQRKLRTVHSVRMISKDKDGVVLMDACYWGDSFGVLVFKDAYRGQVLWRKFHQVSTIKKHLTSRPKTPVGIELRTISLLLCRTDRESVEGTLDDWYSRWLWAFYDSPEAYLPNTNNGTEALFTDLKSKLRVHNGLPKRSHKIFIDEYFRQKSKSLSPKFGR